MHRNEDAMLAMLSAHRAIVDELIVRHRGRIANTASDRNRRTRPRSRCGACAIEIQEALDRANSIEPQDQQMRRSRSGRKDCLHYWPTQVEIGDTWFNSGTEAEIGITVKW